MSPRLLARTSGVFYLGTFVTGSLALAFTGVAGVGVNLIATICYVFVVLYFYRLFKPVNRGISLLAAIVGLAGCLWGTLSLFHLAPFHMSSLAFFGVYCLLIGYLIVRSTFMPRVLGVLMATGGVSWLTFASPALSKALSPYDYYPGVIAEALLTLWLLIFAVNAQRWKEQAGSSGRAGAQPATA